MTKGGIYIRKKHVELAHNIYSKRELRRGLQLVWRKVNPKVLPGRFRVPGQEDKRPAGDKVSSTLCHGRDSV